MICDGSQKNVPGHQKAGATTKTAEEAAAAAAASAAGRLQVLNYASAVYGSSLRGTKCLCWKIIICMFEKTFRQASRNMDQSQEIDGTGS